MDTSSLLKNCLPSHADGFFMLTQHVMPSQKANDQDVSDENWRNSIPILSWVTCGLFLFIFIVYLFKMLSKAGLLPCRAP